MIPEVRNLGSLTGNADSTIPVYAVRQALEELSSNSTWSATAMTQALVAVTLESGRTRLPVGRWFQNPALDLPAWLNRFWRLVKNYARAQLFVKSLHAVVTGGP
jgi:hypothetical protein